jgi:hypothetical protein
MDDDQKDILVGALIRAARDAEETGKKAGRSARNNDQFAAPILARFAATSGRFALAMREALKEIR